MPEMRDAMARLREAQKSSRGAPAYSRFINRPLGRPLAAFAYTRGMTPTQVTLFSGISTALGIVAISVLPPTLWSSVLITVFLALGYALDSADGQLARLTGTGSHSGEWLDHFFDAIKASTLHIAVLISWFRFFDLDTAWLAVPLAFGAVGAVFFFGVVTVDLLRRINQLEKSLPPRKPSGATSSALYSLLVVPADYGLLCILFLTLWLPPVFVTLYTALAVVNALLLVASGLRWYRSLKQLNTEAG